MAEQNAQQSTGRASRLAELRRRKQRRMIRDMAILVVILAALVFYLTGTYSSAIATLGDAAESVQIFLDRSGSFPAQTGIAEPMQVLELGGGFAELGSEDLLIYSGTGSEIRSIQHGYARPAISCGRTRFCVYNRSGTELRVEARTRTLYSQKFDQNILLCQMSQNGSVAVVTQSSRYAAELMVYSPSFDLRYVWDTTEAEGVPICVAFASDNHRLAAGCVSAQGGMLVSNVSLLDTRKDEVVATYQRSGSAILGLEWLSSTQLLCVYDDSACILNPATGAVLAEFDYGGSTVKSVSVCGKTTALLLSTRAGSRLVLLNDSMTPLADAEIALAGKVVCTRTAAYILRDSSVECLSLSGESRWTRSFDTRPQAVLDADQLLVFTDSGAEVLLPPADA